MEYSTCRAELQEDSDGLNYIILSSGYDSKEQALAAMKKIADEQGLEAPDLAVVGVLLAEDLEEGYVSIKVPNSLIDGFLSRWCFVRLGAAWNHSGFRLGIFPLSAPGQNTTEFPTRVRRASLRSAADLRLQLARKRCEACWTRVKSIQTRWVGSKSPRRW